VSRISSEQYDKCLTRNGSKYIAWNPALPWALAGVVIIPLTLREQVFQL
jgi:hypothetical protein